MPVYDFREQLAKGQAHEKLVADFFRGRGWKVSMTDMADQKLGIDMWMEVSVLDGAISFEVKSDELSHKTGNMFVETVGVGRYHDGRFVVEKEGWLYTTQADFLGYHVVGSGELMIFKPDALREFISDNDGRYRSVSVKNSNYSGRGFLVPLVEARDIAAKVLNVSDTKV